MASAFNSFNALAAIGAGQAPSAKKKKNKKPKSQGGAQEAGTAVGSGPAEQQDAVVEVGEACAVLDKTARTFKSGSDRLKLWKDWIKQASHQQDGLGSFIGPVPVLVMLPELGQPCLRCLLFHCRLLTVAPRPLPTRTRMDRCWTSSRQARGPVVARRSEWGGRAAGVLCFLFWGHHIGTVSDPGS
jgi:hypothetical protein